MRGAVVQDVSSDSVRGRNHGNVFTLPIREENGGIQ